MASTPQLQQTQQYATPAQVGAQYQQDLYAQCAQGNHETKRVFGVCGIITAVLCFPCGLICLFSDSEQKCSRCGVRLEK